MNIDPKDPRLIAQAPDLYAAAKAWAVLGWCVSGKSARDKKCLCDWHLCVRAVEAVERDK